jgi:hypothetical protein
VDIPAVLDLGAERAGRALEGAMPPALLPLPHIRVSAVVQESNSLAPGCLRMTPLSEIRCEAASGRRGG